MSLPFVFSDQWIVSNKRALHVFFGTSLPRYSLAVQTGGEYGSNLGFGD